jgi:hypothetical protein
MNKESAEQTKKSVEKNENGSAIVVALMVLALLMVFVALAVSRTSRETMAVANETGEVRAFSAAEASLENMTQQFDSIFDFQVSPTTTDLDNIRNSTPVGFSSNYTFNNEITQIGTSQQVVISGGLMEGLYSTRDAWRLTTTATDKQSDTQVQLRRTFYNDRIPIFQFGIFYDDDLEFHPGPRFDFGGRVHSNGNLFLMAGTGLYFSSRVSAKKQILTDVARNGRPSSQWGENVFVRNGQGAYVQVNSYKGSALRNTVNGSNLFASNPDMPVAYRNLNWSNYETQFDGNLLAEQKELKLPIKAATGASESNYIEIIRRGKEVGDLYNDGTGTVSSPTIVPVTSSTQDNSIVALGRYANQPGIRVSLANNKERLPGCATSTGAAVNTPCGVRLDSDQFGGINRNSANAVISTQATTGAPKGYLPRPMTDGYQSTRLNGARFNTGREIWIKIELTSIDQTTGRPVGQDVTEDILSLGITEQAPRIIESGVDKFRINTANYYTAGTTGMDSRSVIKLQRFVMPGVKIENPGNTNSPFLSDATWNSTVYNFVMPKQGTGSQTYSSAATVDGGFSDIEQNTHPALVDSNNNSWVSPYPIKMFDTREGLYNDNIDTNATYGNKWVTKAGVMSLVEVDIGNLRKFLNGDYNATMPTNTVYAVATGHRLRSTDVPEANGWVLYISDRRGDFDFDGEYDMEDVYGPNDGIKQEGEDVNKNGTLQADYTNEAPYYTGASAKLGADEASVIDHSFFRRAVRLTNGATIPGIYDTVNPLNTKGFTVASENAIYVKGNYNATGISSVGTPTPSTQYIPQNTSLHIPASVVGDAVMILSNAWTDSRSFRYPFSLSNRAASETHVRFAMIAGDTMSSYEASPNQGGGDPRLGGGVHNFKRFLETWSGVRLNYAGSLINMYNSRQNNGPFKCCSKIYSPPTRNWTFDTSFLDAARLPPGTPFFQFIQLTGFQRINN